MKSWNKRKQDDHLFTRRRTYIPSRRTNDILYFIEKKITSLHKKTCYETVKRLEIHLFQLSFFDESFYMNYHVYHYNLHVIITTNMKTVRIIGLFFANLAEIYRIIIIHLRFIFSVLVF